MTAKRKGFAINRGIQKLVISAVLAILIYFVLSALPQSVRLLISWDLFCFSMILFNWFVFFQTDENEICDVVAAQDEGLKVIFSIVLVAVCFSLLGIVLLLQPEEESQVNKVMHALLSLSAVMFSWILLHTIFTIRYAHLYHDDKNLLKTGVQEGGIDFSTDEKPDYLDFAYFSFMVGMTFQVGDVTVSNKVIRRFVLFHSIISFVFNTIIVAVTINAVAGIAK